MKARELERQLKIEIPKQSDKFHSWVLPSSYVVSSNIATIAATAHGLVIGNEININGVVFINPLNDAENQKDGTALATTRFPNDTTFHPNNPTITDQKTTVTLDGAGNIEYNNTFNLVSASNRRNFLFEFPVSAPLNPGGIPVLLEENLQSLNGIFEVASVVDANNFTIAVVKEDFTAPSGVQYYAFKDVRIAADVEVTRTQEAYTEQPTDEYWMFIVPDDTIVSRSRNVASDFITRNEAGSYYQQETEEPFFVFVYIPAVHKYTPVDCMDEARNELKVAILKSLASFFPQDLFFNRYKGVFYTGDGTFLYNNSIYVHQYNFSSTVEIVAQDAYIPNSTAVHTINGSLEVQTNINNI